MIIGISGAHGMGKTTLVNALKNQSELQGFEFKSGLTRDLGKMGFPINEAGTDVTQLFVMSKHYEYARSKGDVILDRCALDGLAYTNVILESSNDNDFKHALGIIARKCFDQYNVIFYVRPELELKDDGVRTVDPVFFKKIVASFEYWLDAIKFYQRAVPVVELSGSVETRVEQVINTLRDRKLID